MVSNIFISLSEEEFKKLIKSTIEEALRNYESLKSTDKDKNQNIILNAEEAAEFLDLALPTLYEKTSKKLIPHFKKSGKLYFIEGDLRKYVQEGKVDSVTQIDLKARK